MSRFVPAFARSAVLAALSLLSLAHSPQLLAAWSRTVTISGSPPATVSVGNSYSFTPTISPQKSYARFSITNKPAWAAFDIYTGRLSGTPSSAGSYGNIGISVTEGRAFASLAPFSITVSAPTSTAVNSPPTISGSPITSVNAGSSYSFTPSAQDPNNDKLTFSVQNCPSWASFNTANGALSGTPASADVGTYGNIVISVSDGQLSASLAPFSIAVNQISNGSAQLDWTPPTQNTDGSALTDLSGYLINYGTSATSLSQSVQIANPGIASYIVTNLSAGTWYFDVIAYTASGLQSAASNVVSKTVN